MESKRVHLELSEFETSLFSLVRSAIEQSPKLVTVRVAGGWVRDKLLGIQSNDIDLVVDSISGEEFGEALASVEASIKILVNPEQSSHIRSIRILIQGNEIDCTQLRKERYGNLRIPDWVGVGTLEDDARRRDFTVNALYWNIMEETVEDVVGGLKDLECKVIRVLGNPSQSLREDPLRILRAIRFAHRLGFKLEDSLAIECSKVDQEWVKVSRERIGDELWKMLCHGPSAIQMLADTCVFTRVFGSQWDQPRIQNSALVSSSMKCPEDTLAAVVLHSHDHMMDILEGLRLTARITDRVIKVANAANQIICLTDTTSIVDCWDSNILGMGRVMYECKEVGVWESVCLLVAAYFSVQGIPSVYDTLVAWTNRVGLHDIRQWRPTLNGKQIMSCFGVKGPTVGKLMDGQLSFRILHPNGSTEQLNEYLLALLVA